MLTDFRSHYCLPVHGSSFQGIVRWTRDVELATLTYPGVTLDDTTLIRDIKVIGTGYSISTTDGDGNPGVLSADVIVVRDFDELEQQAGVSRGVTIIISTIIIIIIITIILRFI